MEITAFLHPPNTASQRLAGQPTVGILQEFHLIVCEG